MNKKRIINLVAICTKNNILDSEKVFSCAKYLSRSELKQFINALKQWQSKTTLTVYLAKNIDTAMQEQIQSLFPTKKIIYKVDATLITGTRIVDNDTVYEMNLRHELKSIANHVQQ